MASLDKKIFLDLQGLTTYDELIKKYIEVKSDSDGAAILDALNDEITRAAAVEGQIITSLAETNKNVEANADAIGVLNGDASTEGSVAKQVLDAINGLIDGAPEALDTLKEIADWIDSDETGTAKLIDTVDKIEKAIENLKQADQELKEYVDTQDEAYYDAISSIQDMEIKSLFPVVQKAEESVEEAVASLQEGDALKLNANQNIAEDISIEKSCYIDANGSTFTGTVSVPADANVIIENAIFSNPVVVV